MKNNSEYNSANFSTWMNKYSIITDYNRLWYIVENNISGHTRRIGKTFAKCHELASCIGLGHDNIVCIISVYRDVDYLMRMISSIFREQNIFLTRNGNNKFTANNSNIIFITEDDYHKRPQFYEYTLIYMRHYD